MSHNDHLGGRETYTTHDDTVYCDVCGEANGLHSRECVAFDPLDHDNYEQLYGGEK